MDWEMVVDWLILILVLVVAGTLEYYVRRSQPKGLDEEVNQRYDYGDK